MFDSIPRRPRISPNALPAPSTAVPAAVSTFLTPTRQLFWLLSGRGMAAWMSDSLHAFLGVRGGATDTGGWLRFVHPEDQEEAWNLLVDGIATGRPFSFTTRLRRHDGVYRLVLHHAEPTEEDVVGLAVDVSDLDLGHTLHLCRSCRRVTDLEGRWRLSWDYLLGRSRLNLTTCIDCSG